FAVGDYSLPWCGNVKLPCQLCYPAPQSIDLGWCPYSVACRERPAMKACPPLNLIGLVVLVLLLSIIGCGGSSNPPCQGANCPCMGSNCPPTTGSDFLFQSYTNTIAGAKVDAVAGTVLATLPNVTGPVQPAGMVLTSTNFLFVDDNNGPGNADVVNAYSVNTSTGALTAVSGSPFSMPFVTPQGMAGLATDPAGKFLYVSNNQDALGGISAYTINGSTGALTAILGSPFTTLINGGPVGLTVHLNGKFLYVAMAGDGTDHRIVVENIDPATGALSPAAGSPFNTGTNPQSLTLDP